MQDVFTSKVHVLSVAVTMKHIVKQYCLHYRIPSKTSQCQSYPFVRVCVYVTIMLANGIY